MLLVVRPVTAGVAPLGSASGPRGRGAVAFSGVRGTGPPFSLAYAPEHEPLRPRVDEPWAVTAWTVLASVVLHGMSATPVVARLDRPRRGAPGTGTRTGGPTGGTPTGGPTG